MNGAAQKNAPARPAARPEPLRFGPRAPLLYRTAAVAVWLALAWRLLASSLPASRSGIDAWIDRSLTVAGLFAQLAVLLGAATLVLLVVATLGNGALSLLYRSFIVPAAAAVLMLVMLAATMGLEPVASFVIGASALLLVLAGAAASLGTPAARAPALVLSAAGLAAATRLAARAIESATEGGHALGLVSGLGTASYVLDALAMALAFARFRSELGRKARLILPVIFLGASALAWGGLRGALDGAAHWQVLASRALSELSELAGSGAYAEGSSLATRFTLDAVGLLLSGTIVLYPRGLSVGALAAALVLLGRHGLDVPACALAAALSGLAVPLSAASRHGDGDVTPLPRSQARTVPLPARRVDA